MSTGTSTVGRLTSPATPEGAAQLVAASQAVGGDIAFLRRMLDSFAIPATIYAPDGLMVYGNQAWEDQLNLADAAAQIGRCNVLDDPVNEAMGLLPTLRDALAGRVATVRDVRVPFDVIATRYPMREPGPSGVVFQDITAFPLLDGHGRAAYIACVFVRTRRYAGRGDLAQALAHLNQHWQNEFDRAALAELAGLSPSHFSRLFKDQTGMTPQEYYRQVKVGKLKEHLADPNLTVTQAFACCGVSHRDRYYQYFTQATGQTPAGYRRTLARALPEPADDAASAHGDAE